MPSLIGKVLNAQGPPVPLAGTSGGWRMPGTTGSRGNRDVALLQAYSSQGTVHANTGLLASSTAAPGWNLYREAPVDGRARYSTSDQGSDQRKQVIKHAALALLNCPAKLTFQGHTMQFWSRFRLFEMSELYLELTGKSHWVIDSKGGVPVGIWPVRPDRMTPVPDPVNYLKGWIYDSPDGSERVPLMPWEVVYNCFPDPMDLYGGASPTGAVLTEIEGARYAAEWNRNFFTNSARPDGVIQVDKRLSDEEWDELSARWREAHRGVARAHRVAVLEAGATWVQTSTNPKDMDFPVLMSTGADRIREAYGMHKVMTGVTEDVNRANAQTGEEVFASWKVRPRLDRWRDVLNTQYLPMFGSAGNGVEFDYVYPAPTNREQDNAELTAKTSAFAALVSVGADSASASEVVGLPPVKMIPKPPPGGLPPGTPGMGGPAGAPAANPGAGEQAAESQGGGNRLPLQIAAWDSLEVMARQQAAWNRLAGAR